MTVIAQARLPLVDPHDCTDVSDALAVLEAVHDPLVRRGATGYEPGLATGWTVSPDARRWTFDLREGVRFHDGTPFDAGAAAATLARMIRPGMGATLGAPAVWAQYLGGARFVPEGAHRLAVELAEPMADLLDVLVYAFAVSPDEAPDARGVPSGTGPWRAAAVQDGALHLEPVPGHWSAPANGALRLRHVPDAGARLKALASGAAAVANDLPFGAPAPAGTTVQGYLDPMAVIFLFNCDRPAVADPRIRRALNLALDRPALLAEVRRGAGVPLHGFVSPLHDGHAETVDTGPFRAEARRLLAEAGAGAGLSLTVDTPTSLPAEAEALTAAVARQLGEVGVALTVRRWEDREAYAHMVRRSEVADLCVFDSSPMSTFRVLHEKIDSRVRGAWWLGYRNPAVEALIDRARAETGEARRHALFRECYRLMQDDPPWLTCYCHRRSIGLRGAHPGWGMRRDGVLDLRALPRLESGR